MKEIVLQVPVTIGEIVYLITKDNVATDENRYWIQKTFVTDISKKHGFTLDCDVNFRGTTTEFDQFRSWDEISYKVFLSREQAESEIMKNDDYNGYIYQDENFKTVKVSKG